MPRKKKPVEALITAQAEAVAATLSGPELTTTEPVANEPVSPPSPPPSQPVMVEPTPPAAEPQPDEPASKTWATSGPNWETTITLGTRNDAPKMRVGRNNKFRQMVIQFDEPPCHDVLDRLHEAEWKRRPAEGVWTMQLELGREARGHQDAVKFFDDLVTLERQARGLDARRSMSR